MSSLADHHGTHVAPKNSWRGVASLAVGAFAFVTAEFLPVGVSSEVATTFNVSSGQAGLMMTVPSVFAACSALAVVVGAGRADRRTVLLSLSFMLLVACLISTFATSFEMMLIGRVLVGLGLGAFWSLSLATAGALVSPDKIHTATAAVFGGVSAAMILGVPIGTFIASLFSWRGAFVATAAISAIAILMQLIALPSIKAGPQLAVSELFRFAANKTAGKSLLVVMLTFGAHFATYTYVAPLLQRHGFNMEDITAILFGFGVIGFFANFIASAFVAERLKAVLITSLFALLFVLVCLPAASAPSLVIGLVLVWGMAWGALPLSINILHRSIAGKPAEPSSAVFTSTVQIAISVGSACGGVLADTSGLNATFWAGAVATGLCTILVVAVLHGVAISLQKGETVSAH